MATASGKVQHYNDWPNSAGVGSLHIISPAQLNQVQFDVKFEEVNPTELEVQGNIPAYAAGVLFRNGLGPREFETEKKNTYRTKHWFDALAQVHRFQIHAPDATRPSVRVTHNSRRTCDGLIERIMRSGQREGYSFAAKYDPCLSFFQKLQSYFVASPTKTTPSGANISVTLSANFPGLSETGQKREKGFDGSRVETLCNKTDSSAVQMLDPNTLEPLGIARQTVLHRSLTGPVSGAHARVCPDTGDLYNYNLELGRNPTYRVFHVSAATGETSVLATINTEAAYIHSVFLSEHYLILCVWNSFFSAGGISILWTRNYLDTISEFDKSKPATWYVIDRTPVESGGKGLVATYESEPFFCFHTINAYEEASATDPSKTDIIADLCTYGNLDVLKRFYLENLMSDSPGALPYSDPSNDSARAQLRRFQLPQVPSTPNPRDKPLRAVPVFTEAKGSAPELPSLNNGVRTRKHRYVYGVTDTGKSTFFDGVIKYDLETLTTQQWSVFGQSAGEPIFVADPDAPAGEEDAGILLTVVLDGTQGKSYLLVLDAKNLQELGRAKVDGVVGFGFHGTHVGNGGQSQL